MVVVVNIGNWINCVLNGFIDHLTSGNLLLRSAARGLLFFGFFGGGGIVVIKSIM